MAASEPLQLIDDIATNGRPFRGISGLQGRNRHAVVGNRYFLAFGDTLQELRELCFRLIGSDLIA